MTARRLTAAQWQALDLVCTRGDRGAATWIVKRTPHGDAAITVRMAAALELRGLVTIVRGSAWPTTAGASALASHRRIEANRATAPAKG